LLYEIVNEGGQQSGECSTTSYQIYPITSTIISSEKSGKHSKADDRTVSIINLSDPW